MSPQAQLASAKERPTYPSPAALGLVGWTELQKILDISHPTLKRIIRTDETFPPTVSIGRKKYVQSGQLERWVANKLRRHAR